MKKIFLMILFLVLVMPMAGHAQEMQQMQQMRGLTQEQQLLMLQQMQQMQQQMQTQQQIQKPSFVVKVRTSGSYGYELDRGASFLIKKFLLDKGLTVISDSTGSYGSYGYYNQGGNGNRNFTVDAEIETDRSYGGLSTGSIPIEWNIFGRNSSSYMEVKTENIQVLVRVSVISPNGEEVAASCCSDTAIAVQIGYSEMAIKNKMRALTNALLVKALQNIFK